MFERIKEMLPDNKNSALLAGGLVLLVAGQLLAQSTNILLLILRYALFVGAVTIYFIVAFDHHRKRLAKKKAKELEGESE